MTETPNQLFTPEDVLAMMRGSTEAGFRTKPLIPDSPSSDADNGLVVPFKPRSVVSEAAPELEPEPMRDPAPEVAPEATPQLEPTAEQFQPDFPPHPEPSPEFTLEPDPAPIDFEAELQAAWNAGHAAAMAEVDQARAEARDAAFADARAAAEKEFAEAREAFLGGFASLLRAESDLIAGLGAALKSSVQAIASARSGQAIDDLPSPFMERVEKLAAQVATGMAKTEVHMNPADLSAIQPHIPSHSPLSSAQLIADASLGRGDLRLRAGDISVSDVIAAHSGGAQA